MKPTLVAPLLFAALWLAAPHRVLAQTVLVVPIHLSDSLDKWNEIPGDEVTLTARNGYSTEVRAYNKCKGHFGTTGKFNINIKNKGTKHISADVMLMPGWNTKYVYEPNNSFHISIPPGESNSSYTELRGCMPKGRRHMDDRQKCEACEPKLVFYNLHIL